MNLERQSHQEFNIGNDNETSKREALNDDESQWHPSSSLTPDREWHKTKTVDNRPPQPWITQMAQACSCKSVVELEYHLEEVFKATNDRLDWHNPEGKPYPHDLSKPFSLILNERGRQVIPLDHFINNDLEYLKGGSSSQKYTTSITKTKAADYGQVKWIEDKGPKRQKFYGYATNIESSKDVYFRHMIIIVTRLEEIIVSRQKRLAIQVYRRRIEQTSSTRQIEDMLLLLFKVKLAKPHFRRTVITNVFNDVH
ncbi:hypothetical protein Tco_0743083 [Tanacetum coccineum]